MGNVERCDKTLPINAMMYHVRKDAALRARWRTDLEGIAGEFGLSREEYEAIRDKDPRRLMDLTCYFGQILGSSRRRCQRRQGDHRIKVTKHVPPNQHQGRRPLP